MRGINKVLLSGNVGDIDYSSLPAGDKVLTFTVASDRRANGGTITAWAKVNVYIDPLIRICRSRLARGGYVIIEGELMNRDGQHGKLTEVRAREIIFVQGGSNGERGSAS